MIREDLCETKLYSTLWERRDVCSFKFMHVLGSLLYPPQKLIVTVPLANHPQPIHPPRLEFNLQKLKEAVIS